MKKVVWRWFFIWDWEKEEQWLNQMAQEGWLMEKQGFCRYVFQQGQPGSYQYRLELLEQNPCSKKSQDYIRFLEETGAEYMGNWLRWVYFRKPTEMGPFDLYSDMESRMGHVKRILIFLALLILAVFPVGLSNVIIGLGPNSSERVMNLGVGIFDMAMGLFLLWHGTKLWNKWKAMKKERSIRE